MNGKIKPDVADVGAWEAEEKRITEQTKANEKMMREAFEKQTADLEAARTKLETEQTELARMIAAYEEAEGKLAGQDEAAIDQKGPALEDLKAGKISADAYIAQAIEPGEAATQARAQAQARLGDLLTAIRAKGITILELEAAAAEAETSLIYAASFPLQTELERRRASVKVLEARLNEKLCGAPEARSIMETKREQLLLARNKSLSGYRWENLAQGEVRKLRFSPIVPTKFLPDLDRIINLIEADAPHKVWAVVFYPGGFGRHERLEHLEMEPPRVRKK